MDTLDSTKNSKPKLFTAEGDTVSGPSTCFTVATPRRAETVAEMLNSGVEGIAVKLQKTELINRDFKSALKALVEADDRNGLSKHLKRQVGLQNGECCDEDACLLSAFDEARNALAKHEAEGGSKIEAEKITGEQDFDPTPG